MESEADRAHEPNPLQSYFDWQVTTIMLARDLHEPVDDPQAAEARRVQIEQEVSAFTLALVPEAYKQDPSLNWPPDLMRQITRETLRRAAQIGRLQSE